MAVICDDGAAITRGRYGTVVGTVWSTARYEGIGGKSVATASPQVDRCVWFGRTGTGHRPTTVGKNKKKFVGRRRTFLVIFVVIHKFSPIRSSFDKRKIPVCWSKVKAYKHSQAVYQTHEATQLRRERHTTRTTTQS